MASKRQNLTYQIRDYYIKKISILHVPASLLTFISDYPFNWNKCHMWNKYLKNQSLNYFVDQSFQGVNRLFVIIN